MGNGDGRGRSDDDGENAAFAVALERAIEGAIAQGAPPEPSPAMTTRDELSLVVMAGKDSGCIFPLRGDVLFLGRGADCEIRVDDEGVSRRHCHLTRTPAGWVIEDQRSSAGTFINRTRKSPHLLAVDDTIQVGSRTILVVTTAANAEGRVRGDPRPSLRHKPTLAALVGEAVASSPAVVLALMNIDRLKAVSDAHGFVAGDVVLSQVGRRAAAAFHEPAVSARVAGDMFAVLLPGPAPDALARFEAFRGAIERTPILLEGTAMSGAPVTITVTISIGVARHSRDLPRSARELVLRADEMLVAAMESGGNAVRAETT